ncbi:MAG: glutaredoxin domain-containing protein [Candidatus Micrarchaeia archaeon]
MKIDIDGSELEELRRKRAEEILSRMSASQVVARVYKTPTCPYCHMAVEYLRSRGVHVEEIDVSRDQNAAMEMVQKSGQMGVPVIEINGRIIIGFNRPAIDAALSLK